MATKSVSIRIEEEMLRKAAYVADYEGRSINSHILVLVRKSIQEFEAVHGRIEESIPPDVNVKPVASIGRRLGQLSDRIIEGANPRRGSPSFQQS